jgi:hypothetical protein
MTAALDPWDVYEELGYDPHPAQQKVLESDARNRVVAAGRRFGKSDIGGHELVPEALLTHSMQHWLRGEGKRREFWIVGPEYSDAEKEFRVCYNNLSKLEVPFDHPGTYNNPHSGDLHISLWGGTFQVHGLSAKYPETLVGEGLHGVILSEAAKLKETVWNKYIRPTLADFDGWSLMTSTPEGKNWFYDRYVVGQDPKRPDWQSWRFPAWRNPYVYKSNTRDDDVQALLGMFHKNREGLSIFEMVEKYGFIINDEIVASVADLTEASFLQEIAADFTEFVGRVFKSFDEEIHVTDLHYEPTWDTVAAVDYGFTNPNVWLLIQVGPWGQVNVLDELYEPGLTAAEFALEIQRRGLAPAGLRTFYPDPASPGDTRQLEQTLRTRASEHTGGELKHRLDAIRKALGPLHNLAGGAIRPRMLIDRKCVNMKREFMDYRYPQNKSEVRENAELPMKKDDHTPEALGRMFRAHFGTPDQQATRIRKRRATIRR